MTDAEVAWLAGLFEGEGCISWIGPNSVQLRIAMTDEDVVRRVHEVAGCGTLKGPWMRKNPNEKPIWGWTIGRREDVINLLLLMRPWLGKRRQERIDLALERTKRHEGRRKVATCGTESGYMRHRRRGERPCGECIEATRTGARHRYRARKGGQ